MTFNLRFDTPVDGVNQWVYRKELVVEAILAHRPDLLATQEGTVPQLEFLAANLPGYLPLIGHREVDPTCQYPTIFYRADGFEVQDSGEFWLSETPLVHRSLSWGSAFPRMLTYGRFQARPRSEWFYFADTHLDHISGEARFKGAQMIREFFSPRPEPLILAGDFNEPPDSPVYREFCGPLPLQDTWRALYPPGEEATTQHTFDGRPRGARIDWILAAPVFRVAKASILDYHQGERYPSDHFPYLVEFEY